MSRIRYHCIRLGQPALAAWLVGIILLLDAMAACPALHELIHHDADQPGHECAVTMFAQGKVDSATVEVPAASAVVSIETVSQIEFSVFHTVLAFLPDGRAPPVLRSVS